MATKDSLRLGAGSKIGTDHVGGTTRFDPPHVPAQSTVSVPGLPGGFPGVRGRATAAPHEEFTSLTDNSLRVMEQLQHHANQLATHLQKQQKDLDDRESRLNAHVASHEGELRVSRLQMGEWEKQLREMERSLSQREHSVRTSESLQAKRATEARAAEKPATASATANLAKQDLPKKVATPNTASQSEPTAKQPAPAKDSPGSKPVTSSQSGKTSAKTPTDTPEKETPAVEEGPISKAVREKQESFANERREKMTLEIMKKKEKIDQRAEQLERRRADLDDLRREVTQLHKDTLEMRLATEELWVRVSGRMPPSAMTRALAELRNKLSDHYRLATAHTAQQKAELETLSNNVHEKYQTLDEHRRNLQEWFHRRNQDIEEQAARLVRREQELDRQETLLRELHQKSQPVMKEPADNKTTVSKKKKEPAGVKLG